jgi:hypothetical protein
MENTKDVGSSRQDDKLDSDHIEGLQCAVMDKGKQSEWFEIKTGVKQFVSCHYDVRIPVSVCDRLDCD